MESDKESISKAFGQVLRNHRLAAELSQEALALETDLDRTFLSMLERGKRQPSLTTLCGLAFALKIHPEKMVRETVDLLPKRQSPRIR